MSKLGAFMSAVPSGAAPNAASATITPLPSAAPTPEVIDQLVLRSEVTILADGQTHHEVLAELSS